MGRPVTAEEIPKTIKFCEAAAVLNVSASTVSDMVKRGEIPASAIVRYGKGRRRIIKSELVKVFKGWQSSNLSDSSSSSGTSANSKSDA